MLLPRLLGRLRAGGVLAVQMPRNFEAPSHALLRETARSGPWADRLAGILEQQPVAAPACVSRPADAARGGAGHLGDGVPARAGGRRPGAELDPRHGAAPGHAGAGRGQFAAFETAYAARLRAAYPRRADGRTLFPFRRLFIVAHRSSVNQPVIQRRGRSVAPRGEQSVWRPRRGWRLRDACRRVTSGCRNCSASAR